LLVVRSHRDGEFVEASFERGKLKNEKKGKNPKEDDGTFVEFEPETMIFKETVTGSTSMAQMRKAFSSLAALPIERATTVQLKTGSRVQLAGGHPADNLRGPASGGLILQAGRLRHCCTFLFAFPTVFFILVEL
jgi:hypothetical protein